MLIIIYKLSLYFQRKGKTEFQMQGNKIFNFTFKVLATLGRKFSCQLIFIILFGRKFFSESNTYIVQASFPLFCTQRR